MQCNQVQIGAVQKSEKYNLQKLRNVASRIRKMKRVNFTYLPIFSMMIIDQDDNWSNDDHDENNHHHASSNSDASPAVGVWDDITVAHREEGDRDQPHRIQQVRVLLIVVPGHEDDDDDVDDDGGDVIHGDYIASKQPTSQFYE